ncbi:hypothetical protein [Novosphingobium sp.]|uniref:hypothetical protein n=1 Tax=Novosphingobium sp. TaxID=1874826 RepID=UPI003D0EC108
MARGLIHQATKNDIVVGPKLDICLSHWCFERLINAAARTLAVHGTGEALFDFIVILVMTVCAYIIVFLYFEQPPSAC